MNDRSPIKTLFLAIAFAGIAHLVLLSGCNQPADTGAKLQPVISSSTNRATNRIAIPIPAIAVVRQAVVTTPVSSPISLISTSVSALVTAPVASTPWLSQVQLAWWPPNDTNITGYAVYYNTNRSSLTSSTSNLRADVGMATNVIIVNLVPEVDYYFTAVAYDSSGMEGADSNVVTNRTQVKTSIRYDRMVIESFGVLGKTNQILITTNMVNWQPVLTFKGDGTVHRVYHTNNLDQAYFRTATQ